jgi:hypothetical protein
VDVRGETVMPFRLGATPEPPIVMAPVPVAVKVRTPALSVVALAGAPVPETAYVVFGDRSET